MDLVGIDVGYAVAQSFTELSFGEPRWKPSPLQARMVAAGRLGRKTGRGWYEYGDGPHRPDDPPAPEGTGADFEARPERRSGALRGAHPRVAGRPRLVGFHLLPGAGLVELTRGPSRPTRPSRPPSAAPPRPACTTSGWATRRGWCWAAIVCCLVNEAAFAIGEGVGSAEDVDAGLKLGLNHPRGPVRVGRGDRPRRACSRRSTACGPSAARSATAPHRCCAARWRWRPALAEAA